MDNNKVIFGLIVTLVITLIVDTSVIKIYYFSFNQSPLTWRIVIFFIISCICFVGLYLVSKFAMYQSNELRSRKVLHMNALHKIVIVSQYTLMALIVFLVFQVLIMSEYNVILLSTVTWISYSTAFIMMAILAFRFFSWFRSNRNQSVLLYGLSSGMLCFTTGFQR